jgi:DNA-binding NarL/FixJ family response regulator
MLWRIMAWGGMMTEPVGIQVLIADDSAPFRMGLRALLKSAPGIHLAGEATNGDEVVALAQQLQPDVILMDLQMPGRSGIEATGEILGASPHIAILVITMFDDNDSVFAVMQAGASGYLLKGARKDEILRAIQGVASGEAIFGPPIAKRMMQFFAQIQAKPKPNPFPELTERERDILEGIAQYQSNIEIARKLMISEKTVRNHVSNIFSKLHVADRTAAILRARSAGLG